MKNLFQIAYFIIISGAVLFSLAISSSSVLLFAALSILVFIFGKSKLKTNPKLKWTLHLLLLIIFIAYTKYPKNFSSCGGLLPDNLGRCPEYSCNGIISFGIGSIDCIFGKLKRTN